MIPSPPVSTYRLQLTPQFGFDAAAAIVPYLQSLGISHLYTSPFFKARPGSTHGYDIVDHTEFNSELGGEAAFLRMSDALLRTNMGLIVDFVPNHMCIEGVRNEWWWTALQFGPRHSDAAHFDIAWAALPGRPRVLLPILGKAYGDALKDGEIGLERVADGFVIRYFDHCFPVRPECQAAAARVGESTERLHRLLERQHYRLADWRLAGSRINYRRFFDINSLAGLRVERKETFDALHPLVARLLEDGRLQGLRIDHIDGLFDPAEYCRRLQTMFRAKGREDVYLVVEKILGEGEALPPWPGVAGTTGYEWMNAITRALADSVGLERLEGSWRAISPDAARFEDVLRKAKAHVLDTLFAGEFNVLAKLLARIAAGHRSTRDLPPNGLRKALRAYITEFPVYRTYAAGDDMPAADRRIVEQTLERIRASGTAADEPLLTFLREALTLELIRRRRGHSPARIRQLVMKLQQLTGPVMAKSLEDTSLYRDHRLLALNEVGNEPSLPALSAAEFHARVRRRNEQFPHGLTATATHDTKRGEDARMRILAIAELAEEWGAQVDNWRALNERHVPAYGDKRAPSIEHEYMLYQAMIGAWPENGPTDDFVQRLCRYAVKAAREGKRESSWLDPDPGYEAALQQFIRALLNRGQSADFLASFEPFAARCGLIGALHSLSQLVLKATMPGVPDFYQGTELWDLSFVDPDNRRPVDFPDRRRALAGITNPNWSDLTANWRDGRIKLALTATLLHLRRRHPALFARGDYSLVNTGSDELMGFRRAYGDQAVLVLAVRRFGRVTNGGLEWPDRFGSGTIDLPEGWGVPKSLLLPACDGMQRRKIVPAEMLGCLPAAVLLLRKGG